MHSSAFEANTKVRFKEPKGIDMFSNLTGWHLLIVLGVVLLLFGSTKLPALARSVGQSIRILRRETSDRDPEEDSPDR